MATKSYRATLRGSTTRRPQRASFALWPIGLLIVSSSVSAQNPAPQNVDPVRARPSQERSMDSMRAQVSRQIAPADAAPRPRITAKVDASLRVPVTGNIHPRIGPHNDLGPVDPSFRLAYITLSLRRTPGQQLALDQLLKDQQNPGSPSFHRFLTPEQFADRFGAVQSDIDALTSWLRSGGFTIVQVARGRDFIVFSGTAEQLEQTFNIGIHHYLVNGEKHFANSGEPWVPQALADIVAGFRGLNDFYPKHSTPMRKLGSAGTFPRPQFVDPQALGSDINVLAPDDFSTIYDVSPLYQMGMNGAGQNLVIVGQSNVNLNDIATFRSVFNLVENYPQVVLVPGTTDPGISGSEGEADLDLEWAGAIAPSASITFVYAPGAFDAAAYAVDNSLAPVISFSFATCEAQATASEATNLEGIAQQANAQGITYIAASGDQGAAACDGGATIASNGLSVNLPASFPEVTGVGGTEFSEGAGGYSAYWSSTLGPNLGSALSYIPEIGWNDTDSQGLNQLSSSGGGYSIYFSKPSFQAGVGVPFDYSRDVPDIALNASPAHDAYFVFSGGQPQAIGGTSAATPSFAGVVVLLNQYLSGGQPSTGLGNINPVLYRLTQNGSATPKPISGGYVYNDITVGSNVVPCESTPDCPSSGYFGYYAGVGYDQVTGLGSIDAYALVSNFTSAEAIPILVTTALTSSTSVQPGGHMNLSVTVANQGQGDAGAFEVGFYLTTSLTQSEYFLFATCGYQDLPAGRSQTCSGIVNVPPWIQSGTYYLVAFADDLNQIVQLDNSQNGRESDSGVINVK